MNKKLLAVSDNLQCDINIGDYVQALAASQFLNGRVGWVERERLKEYDGEPCKVIMNAWYMHHKEQWPPSDKIKPLFVAMHINSMVRDRFVQKDSIEYLKKYEPIGCRDTYTEDLLKKKGIDAYFSGCLTLTLGYKYKSSCCNGKTYIVDPFFKIMKRSLYWKISAFFAFLMHPKATFQIRKKRRLKQSLSIGQILDCAWFVKLYTGIFSMQFLLESEFISQEGPEYGEKFKSNDELLLEAERLIKDYSKASLVVTSRIHCALPCTAMEVPVIYIEDKNLPENSKCRLGGLRELFNIVQFEESKLTPLFNIKGKISANNRPQIKTNYRVLADSLIRKCISFMK